MGWGERHSMELLAHLFQEGLLSLYCFAYLRNMKKLSPVISNRSFAIVLPVHSIKTNIWFYSRIDVTSSDRYVCMLLVISRN